MENKKFKIHWLAKNESPTIVEGPTIGKAMTLAGFGGGITAAIDYWEEIKKEKEND